MAAGDISPYVTLGVERNSNPYGRSNGEPAPMADTGNSQRDDTFERAAAGLIARLGEDNDPTQAHFNAEWSRIDYQRFDTLDHNEYRIGGDLDWQPSQSIGTSLRASREHSLAGLADVGTEDPSPQTNDNAEGSLHLNFTPQWQLGLAPHWSRSQLPLATAPDFQYHETGGTVSLGYIGAGRVVPGLQAGYARGRFMNIPSATRYRQKSAEFTLNYKATGLSTFALSAGRTIRDSNLVDPSDGSAQANSAAVGRNSAFTGSLSYQRELSVKTSVNVRAFRDIQNFDAGANSTVETGFEAGATWAPTVKLSVQLDLRQSRMRINGYVVDQDGSARRDRLHNIDLGIRYAATRWLSIHPYISRQFRLSNSWSDQYNATIAGLELTARME